MKEYIKYKAWWIENHALNKIPSLYWGDTAEQAFAVHVSEFTLYEFMERLADWSEE